MTRTIEEIIKFDSGLSIGVHPVTIARRDGSEYSALVEVKARGAVYLMRKPDEGDMYTSWHRITGNDATPKGGVIVWGARDPELLKRFDNPVATIRFPAKATQPSA